MSSSGEVELRRDPLVERAISQLRSSLREDLERSLDTLADIIVPEPIWTGVLSLCHRECRDRSHDLMSFAQCLADCTRRRLSDHDDARGFADRLERGESVFLMLTPRKK